MDRVKIGMIADGMALECGDDVGASALFEDSGLLSDHLEGGADAAVTQQSGQSKAGIIVGGQQVILRIEPKQDVHPGRNWFGGHPEAKDREDRGDHGPRDGSPEADPVLKRGSHPVVMRLRFRGVERQSVVRLEVEGGATRLGIRADQHSRAGRMPTVHGLEAGLARALMEPDDSQMSPNRNRREHLRVYFLWWNL